MDTEVEFTVTGLSPDAKADLLRNLPKELVADVIPDAKYELVLRPASSNVELSLSQKVHDLTALLLGMRGVAEAASLELRIGAFFSTAFATIKLEAKSLHLLERLNADIVIRAYPCSEEETDSAANAAPGDSTA